MDESEIVNNISLAYISGQLLSFPWIFYKIIFANFHWFNTSFIRLSFRSCESKIDHSHKNPSRDNAKFRLTTNLGVPSAWFLVVTGAPKKFHYKWPGYLFLRVVFYNKKWWHFNRTTFLKYSEGSKVCYCQASVILPDWRNWRHVSRIFQLNQIFLNSKSGSFK